MNAARRWTAFAFRWSWTISLPLLVLFVHWALQSWRRFADFGLRLDASPYAITLRGCGDLELAHLLRQAKLTFTGRQPSDAPAELRLRALQLFVPDDRLAVLDANLPYSGTDKFQRGGLMVGGKLREVDVRYRGDTVLHWGFFKKSFRIKTKKDELFEGMRSFNLIAAKFPEQLNNFLAYKLASALGLIAPRVELVNVWLNGTYHGLYELTEQLDEGTLRRHDRMPGDIYSGELIVAEKVPGTTNRLFELPRLWTKAAADNHRDLADMTPLEQLCALLQTPPDEASHEALAQLVDMDRMALLSAFELLTQTHHDDPSHNWRLYWDPWRSRFEPIAWDPAGWHDSMRPFFGRDIDHDAIYSQLHERLHMDAAFLRARFRHLQRFFSTGLDQQFVAAADRALLQAYAALSADPNVLPQDTDVVVASMLGFREFIARVMRDLRADHVGGAETLAYAAAAGSDTVTLEVTTRAALDGVELVFDRPVQPTAVAMRMERAGGEVRGDLLAGTEVRQERVYVPLPLVSALSREFELRQASIGVRNQRRHVEPTACTLQLTGVDMAHLIEVRARRLDTSVAFVRRPSIGRQPVELLFGLLRDRPLPTTTMAGEVRIEGRRQVQGPVVIQPGTVFVLAPEAVLEFHGRVRAEGSEAQPIRFVQAVAGQPWGAVVLAGVGASGSRLLHCEFAGGSGFKAPRVEYSGMFSIHEATGVLVRDCHFHDNRVVDDMVHVVYGEVRFERCRFQHALSDMLDCDISRVVVSDCRFEDSGNDGIDLMTTRAVVSGCQFARNADKGISIGEGTQLLAVRDRFDGCGKAMEAKDGSLARAANLEIRNCPLALNAYRKNWRYDGGGDLAVSRSWFAGNPALATADRNSKVTITDCRTDLLTLPERNPEGGRNHAMITLSDEGESCLDLSAPPFPVELEALRAAGAAAWRSIVPALRGVPQRDD